MGLRKKNLSDDDRFKRMDEQYEQHRINCKHCVEELQASLNELKIRDTKLTLNPNYGKSKTKLSQAKESLNNPIQNAEESDDSDLEFEEEMKEAEKKTFVPMEKNFDPLHALVQALEDADLECFPPNVLEAFEDNFGFQLTDKTKENLQERLERFFSESETKFIDSFNSNRFNYLIRV